MINKAPKDMSAPEFVALFESRFPGNEIYRGILKKMLDEPAPNPFTPDQLAWMREMQRSGFTHAGMDSDGHVFSYRAKPKKNTITWDTEDPVRGMMETYLKFLNEQLSWDDPEPLCFADYAPLEEK